MRIVTLTEDTKKNILEDLLKRSPNNYTQYEKTVSDIVNNVMQNGDEAVFSYTQQFDKWDCNADNVRVSAKEIADAYTQVDEELISILKEAAENIRLFHEKQLRESWIIPKEDGTILGQKITPIEKAGCYAPGGKAFYPSSVLMNIIPAKVAGVEKIVLCTPGRKEDGSVHPVTLVAADIAGVDEIYKIGGAQAIAALAYGTELIPKVDKIVGPGNIYVATAKKLLYGVVDIDMIAGPSEILVLADETANPKFVAADLMSQAEHDVMASSILVTTSEKLVDETIKELERQVNDLSRKDIIEKSLSTYGAAIVCDCVDCAIELANELAPEHLEVLLQNPMEYLGRLDNAGSIFLGQYAPEPLGDYYAGPNHVLPTSGTARFFSPLSVNSFTKRTSYIYYTEQALLDAKTDIVTIAEKEGLTAHANAIKVRF